MKNTIKFPMMKAQEKKYSQDTKQIKKRALCTNAETKTRIESKKQQFEKKFYEISGLHPQEGGFPDLGDFQKELDTLKFGGLEQIKENSWEYS